MSKSKIEWTDETWNPITGCTKISDGCRNCYAERMSKRLAGRCGYPKDDPFKVNFHHNKLGEPLKWKKPRRVFANSMSDLFHQDVPDSKIDEIFGVMLACRVLTNTPDHVFQILTKRPERMSKYFGEREPKELLKAWAEASNWITLDDEDMLFEELVYSATCRDWDKDGRNSSGSEHKPWSYLDKLWPLPNVWLGVSVENQAAADERIPLLLQTPAAVRFISAEPLLGSINLQSDILGDTLCRCGGCMDYAEKNPGRWQAQRIDWVICGGESGPSARAVHPDWIRNLRDQCQTAKVPFFLKQMHINGKLVKMPELEGRTWDETPEVLNHANKSH